ncbi:MAG: HDOD domain-containing protein [Verrucomicrobiota bacterium]
MVGNIEIPRFRKAVFETLRRLRDPDTTPQKLMEVMAIDGELVGKVMNTVNSTAYSPRSRIQSLDHAILLMGNADLERIVMMVGAKAALPQQGHPKFALSNFWKASSRRAVLAREIADLVQPAKANLSFTAGFLQDLGVPLIVTSRKDDYVSLFNTALEEKRDLHLLEAEALGWDHAELGALLAMNWELPDDVTHCLKDHNHPDSAGRPDPAYFVSSLLPSHGEEWHSHFANQVNDRYVVPPEVLDSICKESIQKANDLAKLF